ARRAVIQGKPRRTVPNMDRTRWLQRLPDLLRGEIAHLTTLKPNTRPWQMPLAAALAIGLPVLYGAAADRLDLGLVASLGGMVFLYLPDTPLAHRMATIMACAFGMIACYALGLISHLVPAVLIPFLAVAAMVTTLATRSYCIAPPGSLLFIMAAVIGAYMPAQPVDFPQAVGVFALGTLSACLIAFFYSVIMLRIRPPGEIQISPDSFQRVAFDAVVTGLAVG